MYVYIKKKVYILDIFYIHLIFSKYILYVCFVRAAERFAVVAPYSLPCLALAFTLCCLSSKL